MEQPIEILKAAFIAHINDMAAKRAVVTCDIVNTHYQMIDGTTKLILVFEDGSEEIFTGLKAA